MLCMTGRASRGQQAQALSLHPGSSQLLGWLVAPEAACHLCLPSVNDDTVWLSPGR